MTAPRSMEEWAEECVRVWQYVDPFARELIEHAKYDLERRIADCARAYAAQVRQAEREAREFLTKDHPMANQRRPIYGEVEWKFTFPLEDGTILTVRVGLVGRNALIRMAHEESTDDAIAAAIRAREP